MRIGTYLSIVTTCESRKASTINFREGGMVGVGVQNDDYALSWQRYDRISTTARRRLLAVAAELERKATAYDKLAAFNRAMAQL